MCSAERVEEDNTAGPHGKVQPSGSVCGARTTTASSNFMCYCLGRTFCAGTTWHIVRGSYTQVASMSIFNFNAYWGCTCSTAPPGVLQLLEVGVSVRAFVCVFGETCLSSIFFQNTPLPGVPLCFEHTAPLEVANHLEEGSDCPDIFPCTPCTPICPLVLVHMMIPPHHYGG